MFPCTVTVPYPLLPRRYLSPNPTPRRAETGQTLSVFICFPSPIILISIIVVPQIVYRTLQLYILVDFYLSLTDTYRYLQPHVIALAFGQLIYFVLVVMFCDRYM